MLNTEDTKEHKKHGELMKEVNRDLVGTWVTQEEDSDAVFNVSVVEGEYTVSGYDRSDGEAFEITDVSWNGVALSFVAIMPSTGFKSKNSFIMHPDGLPSWNSPFTRFGRKSSESKASVTGGSNCFYPSLMLPAHW